MFSKEKLVDLFGYGIGFWLLGYIAGIILFMFLPLNLLGWVLIIIFSPIYIYLTLKRFKNRDEEFKYYGLIAIVWTVIAIVFDYLFIVMLFSNPNYYQIDIAVYYLITFIVPLGIGFAKSKDIVNPK